jgi:hypothetical protein
MVWPLPPLFSQLADETRGALACGRGAIVLNKMACLQGFHALMFSPVTTRAEREEIFEQVRARHRVMNRKPLAGAAAHAAVSVTEPRCSSQLLPRETVELRARGTRALRTGACRAPASSFYGDKHPAVRAYVSQDHARRIPRIESVPRRLASARGSDWHKTILWIGVDKPTRLVDEALAICATT